MRNERQTKPLVFADCPIPAAVRTEDDLGAASRPNELLVRDSHDVEGEVMTGIAPMPLPDPVWILRPIILRGQGIVDVAKPKAWIEFLRRRRSVQRGIGVDAHDPRVVGWPGRIGDWRAAIQAGLG